MVHFLCSDAADVAAVLGDWSLGGGGAWLVSTGEWLSPSAWLSHVSHGVEAGCIPCVVGVLRLARVVGPYVGGAQLGVLVRDWPRYEGQRPEQQCPQRSPSAVRASWFAVYRVCSLQRQLTFLFMGSYLADVKRKSVRTCQMHDTHARLAS